jgi:Protein of unknown function (DUF3616)
MSNTRSVVLEFDSSLDRINNGKLLRDSLSAVVSVGHHLLLASDETTSIEQLTTTDGVTFRNHKRIRLSKFFRLPGGDDKEVDIEGLAYCDNHLWVVGSHSLARKKPDQASSDARQQIKQLAKIERTDNRYLLARIPLVRQAGGLELFDSCSDPFDPSRTLTSSSLPFTNGGNELMEALSTDAHLSPFLSIPGKDNGFDIEGLAVCGERIFVGLRGPVLRGWALVIEMEAKKSSGPVSLKEIGPKDRIYKKHLLQLDGLGVRELLIDGADILLLAGPTMNLDGPVSVFRWREAMRVSNETLVPGAQLKKLFEVPYGAGADHAEGITFISNAGEPPALLVVYDAPSAERKRGLPDTAVRADVFELR